MNLKKIMKLAHIKYIIFTIMLPALLLYSCKRERIHHQPPVKGSNIVIDTAILKEGIPRFYTYRSEDIPISFFVVKTGDGVFSYFDACAKCHPFKKGYTYTDGRLLCNHCGHSRSVHTLDKEIGGCYPLPLGGRLEDDIYKIRLTSIIQGKVFF